MELECVENRKGKNGIIENRKEKNFTLRDKTQEVLQKFVFVSLLFLHFSPTYTNQFVGGF